MWVACSGGLDSVTLALSAAAVLGRRVRLVHLDHGLRGRGSRDDAAFVSALAAALDAPLLRRTRRPDPTLVAEVGLQAAARARRLELFAGLPGRVLLAHHADDQAETRALQAASNHPRCGGMPARRGRLLRPFLSLSRQVLRALAEERGWTWREDPSNDDPRFARIQVRRDLARGLAPSVRTGVTVAPLKGAPPRTYVAGVEAELPRLVLAGPENPVLDRTVLAHLEESVALTALSRILPPATPGGRAPSRAARRALWALAGDAFGGEERRLDLGGWTARVRHGEVRLSRARRSAGPPTVGVVEVEPSRARDLLRVRGVGRRFALVDPDSVPALHLSFVRSGRRMEPFGSAHSTLLRDLLAEAGVPEDLRARWPVVEAADGRVVWLPGARASRHGPLTAGSKRAFVLYTVAPRAAGPGTPDGNS